jgi:hypothetical protein
MGPSGVVSGRSEARPAPAIIEEEFAGAQARSDHPQAYIECGMQTASQRQGDDAAEICALQREIAVRHWDRR